MNKEIIVFSGIQPGKKGTGNLVSFFLEKLKSHNVKFHLIAYKTPNGGYLIKLAKKLGIVKYIRSVYYTLVRRSSSKKNITNSVVLLFHPQSVGLKTTADLIQNNKVYIYVLDTFLFCKKSYNYVQGNRSCLECISNPNAYVKNSCGFFPSQQNQAEYDVLQNIISSNLNSICFLTQNENQSKLLEKKFGSSINTMQLGMLIEICENEFHDTEVVERKYDFVYHNTNMKAKGIGYFIELASAMPNYKFLIPYAQEDLDNFNLKHISNLYCVSMSWATGLKDAVRNAKVVLNPSLWSAPVEGALLKSIKTNGCVAIVPVEYSFQKEIPSNTVIHLSEDLNESVETLVDIVQSDELMKCYKTNSAKWIAEYENQTMASFDKFIIEELVNAK